jgi:hypothetical protein
MTFYELEFHLSLSIKTALPGNGQYAKAPPAIIPSIPCVFSPARLTVQDSASWMSTVHCPHTSHMWLMHKVGARLPQPLATAANIGARTKCLT